MSNKTKEAGGEEKAKQALESKQRGKCQRFGLAFETELMDSALRSHSFECALSAVSLPRAVSERKEC